MKVFVKHDAWNAFGEGDMVQMPIKIFNIPKLIQSPEPWRVPENWNPTSGSGGNIGYLYQDEKITSDFYKKVYE
jgi:hypothetical protein